MAPLSSTITRRHVLAMAAAATPSVPFQRGVNYTAEFPDGYASERARQILRSLPQYGINAVAFVPYGFAPKGEPSVRFSGTRTMERDDAIAQLSEVARATGLQVFLKPQLWLRGGSTTDIDFPKESDRKQWFQQYRLFLEHYAALATRIRASLFSVGVEFSRLARYEAEWRSLIHCARQLYPGKLTYSANFGPEFETARFWDVVDYIGLNNYYPLPDDLSTTATVARVEAVHKKFGKPVIFAEAGFASLEAPHRQPWDETPRKLSPEDQARCYEAIFQGFYNKPWFQGVYWWKVGTNGFGGPSDGSHTPWNKPAMKVVSRWYLRGGR
jgi:hypothetical protein